MIKHALSAILTVEEVQSLSYQGDYDIPDNLEHLVPARQTALQALAEIPINIMRDQSAIPGPSLSIQRLSNRAPIPLPRTTIEPPIIALTMVQVIPMYTSEAPEKEDFGSSSSLSKP